jgi:hypothetical protein
MHKHQARASLVTAQLAVLLFKGSGRSVVDGGHCALLVQVCGCSAVAVSCFWWRCVVAGGSRGEGQLQRGTHDMMAGYLSVFVYEAERSGCRG